MQPGRELAAIFKQQRGRYTPAQGHARGALQGSWWPRLRHTSLFSGHPKERVSAPKDLTTSPSPGLSCLRQQPSAPHCAAVVLISPSAKQTYLVVAAVCVGVRPREAVLARSRQKLFQKIQWVTPLLRFFQPSRKRWKNDFWSFSNSSSVASRNSGGCDLETNESTEASFFFGSGP